MAAAYEPVKRQLEQSYHENHGIPLYDTTDSSHIIYNPIEPAPIRRRPLPPGARTTLEEPLLVEESPFHQPGSIDLGTSNTDYGQVDRKGKDDYITTVQSYYSPGFDQEKTNPLGPQQVPKPITRTNWMRYLNGWLVHIPAVGSTVVTIWISKEKWYWFPEDGPWDGISADVINNILQFAAKLHELLIVASLSSIAIAMIRRRLVGGGLRLGFLTGGYRVGDLNYLVSSPFRRQGLSRSMPWEIFLVIYLVFATILSTIVGPASAVLLVPTLGWFPLKHDRAFSKLNLPLYYDTSPEGVWPVLFTDAAPWNETRDKCVTVEGLYYAGCPAGGYTEIWNWVQSFGSTDLRNNLTFNYPSTELRRHLVFTQPDTSSQADEKPTLLTTPSDFFMTTFGLFQKHLESHSVGDVSGDSRYELKAKLADPENLSKERPIYQPFVQSKCKVYNKNMILETDETMYYPTEYLNCFGDAECEQLKSNPPQVNVTWWKDEEDTETQIAAGYFPFHDLSSVILTVGQVPDQQQDRRERDILYTCSLLASWVGSNFSIDPKVTDVLQSSLNNEERMREVFRSTTLEEGQVIRFNDSWFDYLTPRFNTTTRKSPPTTALLQLVDLFTHASVGSLNPLQSSINDRSTAQAELFLAKVFGVYLTDGIARTGSQDSIYLKVKNTTDSLEMVELNSQYAQSKGSWNIHRLNSTHTTWQLGGEELTIPMSLDRILEELETGVMQYDFDVQRYGYGTGRERRTLTFALIMMFIYLAIVASYALTVGVAHAIELTGRGRRLRVLSVLPWSDLQDLVILALKTPPPKDEDLADAGAGVTSHDVWKKRVRARADGQQNVQLVLNDETSTQKLDVTGKLKYY